MLELLNINAAAGPDGFTFLAKLRDGSAVFDVPVGIGELRCYAMFQARVLIVLGKMIWIATCEHRTQEAADSEWRWQASVLLDKSAPAQQGAGKSLN